MRTVATLATLLLAVFAQLQEPAARRGFSVKIVEPPDQSIVLGKSRIAAEVEIAQPELVDRVEFFVGEQLIYVDREPPYECTFDFGEESKAWVIRAVAHHKEDVTISDTVTTRHVPYIDVARVNRVILWLAATDREDRPLTDLRREQFRLFEEGKEQQILDFTREDRPITMAILLDSSGSMQEQLEEVHLAASSFVDALRDQDSALVIDFDDKVFLVQDLTSDREALKAALRSTKAIGGSAIYDALHAAYRKIGKLSGRKAIVLLSDGDDTASQFGFARVLEEAKANSTIIYTIGLGSGWGSGGGGKNVLKDFARVTGGRSFFVGKAEELGEVYQRIAEELRTQYYVSYSTPNEVWDGRWIDLRIEPTEPGMNVRHRAGYFAVRSSN